MNRPLGKFPQWPAGVAADYLTPGTQDPDVANYPFGEMSKWFAVHDGIEVANYTNTIQLDSGSGPVGGNSLWGTPGDVWRRNHLAFDSAHSIYYAGAMNAGDNTYAAILWSRDGLNWSYDTSSLQVSGVVTKMWYNIALKPNGDAFAWVVGHQSGTYRQSRYMYREAPPYPFPVAGWTEYTTSPGGKPVIENAVWDPEEGRFYLVGWSYDSGDGGVWFAETGTTTFLATWANDFAPAGIQLRFVAVGPGNKLVASPTHLWWGQSILSTFRHMAIIDAMPGASLIKGLTYSDTDKLFIAVTDLGVWVSANGVQWSRTNAPTGGRVYTGVIGVLGGAVVVATTQPAYVVGLNNLRDWYSIPSPTSNSPNNPTQNLYTLGNRLAALNTKSAAGIRYSLGTP